VEAGVVAVDLDLSRRGDVDDARRGLADPFGERLPRPRPLVRPIYVERGILPVIATGLSDAAALSEEAER
jgi:hypothetical protein